MSGTTSKVMFKNGGVDLCKHSKELDAEIKRDAMKPFSVFMKAHPKFQTVVGGLLVEGRISEDYTWSVLRKEKDDTVYLAFHDRGKNGVREKIPAIALGEDIERGAREVLTKKDAILAKHNEEFHNPNEKIRTLYKTIHEHETLIVEMRENYGELKAQLDGAEAEKVKHFEEGMEMGQKLMAMEEELEKRDALLQMREHEMSREKAASEKTAADQIVKLTEQLAKLTNALKAKDEAIADLKIEVEDRDADIVSLTQKLNSK